MSKIGEQLLLALNRLMPGSNQELLHAKQDSLSYMRFFEARAVSSFTTFGEVDMAGKSVLDVGCGLGGNLAHLHRLGAAHVTALDISFEQIKPTENAFAKHYPEYATRTWFVSADATRMPFASESFEVLISADTFEHIDDLSSALVECLRVLRPSGLLYAYFPPFYAPWGAHMVNWIRIPWCQVLFDESTLVGAARKLEQQGEATNCRLPAETRLDLQEGDTIPFVNHLTVGQFEQILENMPSWRVVQKKLLSPGWRANGLASKFMRPVTQFPLLQEMFTAKAVYILQKRPAPS